MALLTRQTITQEGLAPVFASLGAAGDQVVNDDRTIIAVRTTTDTTVVTVPKVRDVSKEGYGTVEVPDIEVTVNANTTAFIAAPPAAYNAGALLNITYDQTTGATIAVLVRPLD